MWNGETLLLANIQMSTTVCHVHQSSWSSAYRKISKSRIILAACKLCRTKLTVQLSVGRMEGDGIRSKLVMGSQRQRQHHRQIGRNKSSFSIARHWVQTWTDWQTRGGGRVWVSAKAFDTRQIQIWRNISTVYVSAVIIIKHRIYGKPERMGGGVVPRRRRRPALDKRGDTQSWRTLINVTFLNDSWNWALSFALFGNDNDQ